MNCKWNANNFSIFSDIKNFDKYHFFTFQLYFIFTFKQYIYMYLSPYGLNLILIKSNWVLKSVLITQSFTEFFIFATFCK